MPFFGYNKEALATSVLKSKKKQAKNILNKEISNLDFTREGSSVPFYKDLQF